MNFVPNNINEIWLTDITEEKVENKKVYISTIYDTFDNYPIACEVSIRNDSELVERTLKIATEKYNNVTPIFHSDRGSSYTREAFKEKLKEIGYVHSMSRVSRCIDNGPTEGFWGIIKSEMYYLKKYNSLEELREDIIQYIYFYNYERLQERFDDRTPMAVRIAALTAENVTQYPIKENKRIQKYYANLKFKQEQYPIA